MGTPEFAVPTLEAIHKSTHEIVAVITSVDKMGGRGGKKVLSSAVKKYAEDHNLYILQPKNLKSKDFNKELKALKADVQIVVAFRMLPEMVWNMPPLGTINLHGSLLPKYRGAAPINWAVINGDPFTGVTTFKLKHEIDTGDMIYQTKVLINDQDSAGDVHDKMMVEGAKLMLKTLNDLSDDNIEFKMQRESEVSKAPKIYRETCKIDFNRKVEDVHNFIRGLSPYPGAWCAINQNTELKILKAHYNLTDETHSTGTLHTDNKSYLKIDCLGGQVILDVVQLSGKKRMKVKDLLNGYKFDDKSILD